MSVVVGPSEDRPASVRVVVNCTNFNYTNVIVEFKQVVSFLCGENYSFTNTRFRALLTYRSYTDLNVYWAIIIIIVQ